jgi:DNA-binding MarR family transcriptional regulator
MKRKLPPRRRPRPRTAHGEVQTVVDETIALYRWLAWIAEELYGSDARGAARRWALRRLHRDGPLTVPALARVRAVRRQTLQPIIDQLAAERLVTMAPNPAHARSPLVVLTDRGLSMVARLDRVDVAVLRAVGRGLLPRDLAITAATLRTLRAGFESSARWRPAALAAR